MTARPAERPLERPLERLGDLIGSRRWGWLAILAAAAAIVSANLLAPPMADDLCRLFPEAGIAGYFRNATSEYLSWSGRYPPVVLTYFALNEGWAWVIHVAVNSALALVLMLWLPRYHLNRLPEGWTLWNTLLVWALLWGATQAYGYSTFFVTGSIQYGWSTVMALAFLWPYKAFWFDQGRRLRPITAVGHVFLALLLGAWMEHLSAGLVVAVGLMLGWSALRRRPVPLSLWLAWGALIAGTAILIAAPGNYARLEVSDQSVPSVLASFIGLHVSFFIGVVLKYIALVGLGLLLFPTLYRDFGWRAAWSRAWPYLLVGYLIAMAMLGARYSSVNFSRAFYSEIFFLIAFIQVMRPLRWPHSWPAIVPIAAAVALLLVMQQGYYWAARIQANQAHARIEEQIAAGATDLVIDRWRAFGILDISLFSGGPVSGTDIGSDPAAAHNRCLARALGVTSIRSEN